MKSKFVAGKASLLVLTLVFAVFAFLLGKSLTTVSATKPDPYKIICHHTPANEVTHRFSNEQSYSGHLGTPHSGETYDTDGECTEPDDTIDYGCTDESALNYDPEADEDDGSCEYENDACPNLRGLQETVPNGYELDNENNCVPVPSPTPNPDVCQNLDGIQTSVPDGLHLGADNVSCVSFSQPGAPEPPAVGGQVLGATTIAKTGTFTENLYLAIMTLGGLLTLKGLKKSSSLNR